MHNPERLYVCEKCGRTFPDITRLKSHVHYEHAEHEPQQCSECNKWYPSKLALNEHARNLHMNTDLEYRCQTCGFVSTTARALRRHERFNHEMERKYKCTMCEKGFKRPQNLKVLHLNCQSFFFPPFPSNWLFSFKEHMATHTGQPLYSCIYCEAQFKSNSNLYHHRRRFHKAEMAEENLKVPREKIIQT